MLASHVPSRSMLLDTVIMRDQVVSIAAMVRQLMAGMDQRAADFVMRVIDGPEVCNKLLNNTK